MEGCCTGTGDILDELPEGGIFRVDSPRPVYTRGESLELLLGLGIGIPCGKDDLLLLGLGIGIPCGKDDLLLLGLGLGIPCGKDDLLLTMGDSCVVRSVEGVILLSLLPH